MKLLVTGFGPFPGVPFNSSDALVSGWIRNRPDWHFDDLRFEVLPTAYEAAGTRVAELLREFRPARALLLGVAGADCGIRMERFALNIDDGAAPDEAGQRRQARSIVAGAPDALRTMLDLEQMHGALIDQGVNAEISNHAGAYVCNHAYYCALHAAAAMMPPCKVLFVHLPRPREGATPGDCAFPGGTR